MANPLTREELEAIKERVSKATPGPWFVSSADSPPIRWGLATLGDDSAPHGSPERAVYVECERKSLVARPTDDAAFIAHARQDVPALLSEVERLREENEKLRKDYSDENYKRIGLTKDKDALWGRIDRLDRLCAEAADALDSFASYCDPDDPIRAPAKIAAEDIRVKLTAIVDPKEQKPHG